MLETWQKGNETITFATEGGVILNKGGTVRGFTRTELIENGWKRSDVIEKKFALNELELDKSDEEWEYVDASEVELIDDSEIIEID